MPNRTQIRACNPPDGTLAAPLEVSGEFHERHEANTPAAERKRRGQFFTPPPVANFMAELLPAFPEHMKVLDPGAGTGTLSAAICRRILRNRSPRSLELVLYETDPAVTKLLDESMKSCRAALSRAGHRLAYEIRQDDFILSHHHAFHDPSLFEAPRAIELYDAVIMNPPYFKIQKRSEYARLMERVVNGQPNIYALFMAIAAELLKQGGALVAITPRSFCGGLYFRGFRRWFFERMSLRHIHLFESRRDAFCGANVLQESVITSTMRSTKATETVTITTSFGGDLEQKPTTRQIQTSIIVDDTRGNLVIRIPENSEDTHIMQLVESWTARFEDHGLRVSTGPVVMFRATEFLLASSDCQDAAPLLAAHNVRPFETIWPLRKNGKPVAFKVCAESHRRRLLLPAKNYVLLRRISAKEEHRRLTASCLLEVNLASPYVALENHINYIYHAERELTDAETYGVAAIFNSALLDRYFRTLSGNTQVNATELRTMHFPDLETIARIGRRIKGLRELELKLAEHIVLAELEVSGTLEQYLAELAR